MNIQNNKPESRISLNEAATPMVLSSVVTRNVCKIDETIEHNIFNHRNNYFGLAVSQLKSLFDRKPIDIQQAKRISNEFLKVINLEKQDSYEDYIFLTQAGSNYNLNNHLSSSNVNIRSVKIDFYNPDAFKSELQSLHLNHHQSAALIISNKLEFSPKKNARAHCISLALIYYDRCDDNNSKATLSLDNKEYVYNGSAQDVFKNSFQLLKAVLLIDIKEFDATHEVFKLITVCRKHLPEQTEASAS